MNLYYLFDYHAHATQYDFPLRLSSRLAAMIGHFGGNSYFGLPLPTPPHEGAKAIDVGSGSGSLSIMLGNMGWLVVGLDLSAAATSVESRHDLQCVRASATHLPFANDTFDLVVVSQLV